MANIKSAKKRAKTNEIRRQRNVARRSEIKTITKKVVERLESSDFDGARAVLREAQSKIARAQGKGVIKRNTAARKISRLTKKINTAAGQ